MRHTQVGIGSNVVFPVEALGHNIDSQDPTNDLVDNTYALGFWIYDQIVLQYGLAMADMVNPAGNRVSPNADTVLSAFNDFSSFPNTTNFVMGNGNSSWPLATYHQFIVHQSLMTDCLKAQGLVDWIYWSQTNPSAISIANQ